MAVFFTSPSRTPALHSALSDALRTDPQQVGDIDAKASALVNQIQQEVPKPQLSGPRVIAASVLLALLVIGVVFTAHDPALASLNATLLHSFELAFGIFLGMLGGEAAAA